MFLPVAGLIYNGRCSETGRQKLRDSEPQIVKDDPTLPQAVAMLYATVTGKTSSDAHDAQCRTRLSASLSGTAGVRLQATVGTRTKGQRWSDGRRLARSNLLLQKRLRWLTARAILGSII